MANSTRERLAELAYVFKSNGCLVPFKDQGDLLRAECFAHADEMLGIIAQPSAAVMEVVDTKIHPTWLVWMAFDVMIRAIKEGK